VGQVGGASKRGEGVRRSCLGAPGRRAAKWSDSAPVEFALCLTNGGYCELLFVQDDGPGGILHYGEFKIEHRSVLFPLISWHTLPRVL